VSELECQSGPRSSTVSCVMGVEWQVLDVPSDTVVYKVMSRGRVLDAPKEPAVTLGKRLVVANLASLSQRPPFRRLLEPEPKASPTQGYARATLRACKAAPRAMPAASEQVLEATVVVQTSNGFGSGFILGADGYIVTAAHVVPESSATVRLRDGREYPAVVIRVDRRIDIALLRLALPEGSTLPCLTLRTAPVGLGADVYAVGAPTSRELSFSLARGIVSGVRLLNGLQYLQTDAAINSGNSGGPLVTAAGEAAAIVSFKLVGASIEGVAFGVPLGAGLNALGVASAEGFTSPELASAGAVAPRAARKLLVDQADPAPGLGSAPVHDTHVQGVSSSRTTSPIVKRYVFGFAGAALVPGLLVLTTSYATNNTDHPALTKAGWALTGIGAVLLGIGFVLP
jgi:S1-C subfamily serine protease